MRSTFQKTKVGYTINTVEMNEKEFKNFVVECLEILLNNWKEYFSNYYEKVMYDIDYLKVSINGKVYKIKNEKNFVKVIEEIFGPLDKKLLELMKKEMQI